jgi:hypothetical protein
MSEKWRVVLQEQTQQSTSLEWKLTVYNLFTVHSISGLALLSAVYQTGHPKGNMTLQNKLALYELCLITTENGLERKI